MEDKDLDFFESLPENVQIVLGVVNTKLSGIEVDVVGLTVMYKTLVGLLFEIESNPEVDAQEIIENGIKNVKIRLGMEQ